MENIDNSLFFKNRLAVLRGLISKINLDCIVIILGISSLSNTSQHKLANWLLFNHSSNISLEEKLIPTSHEETFLIITKESLFIFSIEENQKELYDLCLGCGVKVSFYFPSKEESNENDLFQNIKISKFIENLHEYKTIGMALSMKESSNKIEIEKWPLVNAYGIDVLRQGFFTLNKEIIDLSKYLDMNRSYIDMNTSSISQVSNLIYFTYDLSSVFNLIPNKVQKQERLINDMFSLFNKENPCNRHGKSAEYFFSNSEIELLVNNFFQKKETFFSFLSNLPSPSLKIGVNSLRNKEFSMSLPLYKTEYDYMTPSFYFLYENLDPITGIRLGRTYFLYNLMKEYCFYNETNETKVFQSKVYEEVYFLSQLYIKIIQTIRQFETRLIDDVNDSSGVKFKFTSQLVYELNSIYKSHLNYSNNIKGINSKDVSVNVEYYSIQSMSKVSNQVNSRFLNDKSLFVIGVIRVQVFDVVSVISNRLYGSILFSDSYLVSINNKTYNLTKDILPIKYIYSTDDHIYEKEIMNNTFDHSTRYYTYYKFLKHNKTLLFKPISYKASSFVIDKFNFDYLFPSSKEFSLDHNQLFLTFSGNLILMNEVFIFEDTSLGCFSIDYEIINSIDYINTDTYLIFLVNISNSKGIPYTGLIKNEILFFFQKEYLNKEEIDAFLKEIQVEIKEKVSFMSQNKKFEYDLLIKLYIDSYIKTNSVGSSIENKEKSYKNHDFDSKSFFDNGLTKLNNVNEQTNDYNLTTIYDELSIQLPQFEYLKNLNIEKSYEDYLKNVSSFNIVASLLTTNKKIENQSLKAILLVGTCKEKLSFFSILLRDYFCLKGSYCEINKITPKAKIIIFTIETSSIGNELYNLILSQIPLTKVDLKSISYVINEKTMIIDENFNASDQLNSVFDENLFKIILYDAEILMNKDWSHWKNMKDLLMIISKKRKLYNSLSILNKNHDLYNDILNISHSNDEGEGESNGLCFDYKDYIYNYYYIDYFNKAVSYKSTCEYIEIPQKFKFNEEIFMNWIRKFPNSLFNHTISQLKSHLNQSISLNQIDTNEVKNNQSYLSIIQSDSQLDDFLNKQNQVKSKTKPNFFQNQLDFLLNHIKSYLSTCLSKQKEAFIVNIEGVVKFESNIIIKFYTNGVDSIYLPVNSKEKLNELDSSKGFHLSLYGSNLSRFKETISESLLCLCGNLPKRKGFKDSSDITQDEINNLNLINFNQPIPDGWYTDGPFFIDNKGFRHHNHPSIGRFIDEYLNITNLGIDEYNKKVDEEMERLRID